MKLKYYLRGLGIGIIVTALLMGYSDSKAADDNNKEQIVEVQTSETETIIEEESSEVIHIEEMQSTEQILTEEQMETDSEKNSETFTEEVSEDEETMTQEENTSETVEEQNTQIATVSVEEDAQESFLLNIVRGDDSGTVARKLQNAGIIESATEFDAFLMQHGYDKKISVGVVEIPVGSTWIEIAEKLAGK